MENEKKDFPVDPERPKAKNDTGWEPNGCPFFIFGDEDAAEYDMKALKSFFDRFKKKK